MKAPKPRSETPDVHLNTLYMGAMAIYHPWPSTDVNARPSMLGSKKGFPVDCPAYGRSGLLKLEQEH